jgi:peroxiredoxin
VAATSRPQPLRPGDPAPEVDLPAADGAGTVSLSGYRGQAPVLLALFRGLYCPFCRRQMAQLAPTSRELKAAGVETIGVVATAAERARLYFRYRPAPFPIGADPDLATHRAFGLPQFPLTPEVEQLVEAAASDLARELGIPVVSGEALGAIKTFDGFQPVEEDARDAERDQALVIGQFLIGRDGIVRWVNVEGEPGELPSAREVLAAAADLA